MRDNMLNERLRIQAIVAPVAHALPDNLEVADISTMVRDVYDAVFEYIQEKNSSDISWPSLNHIVYLASLEYYHEGATQDLIEKSVRNNASLCYDCDHLSDKAYWVGHLVKGLSKKPIEGIVELEISGERFSLYTLLDDLYEDYSGYTVKGEPCCPKCKSLNYY